MVGSGVNEDNWVEVSRVENHLEAEVVRSLLASEGIPVLLVGALDESAYVIRVGPLAEVRVLVPASRAALAHALLEARADDEAYSDAGATEGLEE